jgi:hypothetical protein
MACTDQILQRINDPVEFSTWHTATRNAVQPTSTTTESRIGELDSEVSNTIACLQTKIVAARSTSSNVATLYQQYSALQADYQAKTDALKISQDRVKLLTHPEQKTTVYESWFPLHRPLQTSSFLVLIVTSLFFFSVFVGLLARQMGIFVDMGYMYTPPTPGSFFAFIMSKLNYLTVGLGIALVASIGAIIYLRTKKA